MNCPKCGTPIPPGELSCPHCGCVAESKKWNRTAKQNTETEEDMQANLELQIKLFRVILPLATVLVFGLCYLTIYALPIIALWIAALITYGVTLKAKIPSAVWWIAAAGTYAALVKFLHPENHVFIIVVSMFVFPVVGLLCYSFFLPSPHQNSPVYTNAQINSMTGVEYEKYIARCMAACGYRGIQFTPATNDFGVDIVATDQNGRLCAVQCKRYSSNLGIKPIQEVNAGATHYGCTRKIVVTNSYFTKNAKQLAKELGVELWDRNSIL